MAKEKFIPLAAPSIKERFNPPVVTAAPDVLQDFAFDPSKIGSQFYPSRTPPTQMLEQVIKGAASRLEQLKGETPDVFYLTLEMGQSLGYDAEPALDLLELPAGSIFTDSKGQELEADTSVVLPNHCLHHHLISTRAQTMAEPLGMMKIDSDEEWLAANRFLMLMRRSPYVDGEGESFVIEAVTPTAMDLKHPTAPADLPARILMVTPGQLDLIEDKKARPTKRFPAPRTGQPLRVRVVESKGVVLKRHNHPLLKKFRAQFGFSPTPN